MPRQRRRSHPEIAIRVNQLHITPADPLQSIAHPTPIAPRQLPTSYLLHPQRRQRLPMPSARPSARPAARRMPLWGPVTMTVRPAIPSSSKPEALMNAAYGRPAQRCDDVAVGPFLIATGGALIPCVALAAALLAMSPAGGRRSASRKRRRR